MARTTTSPLLRPTRMRSSSPQLELLKAAVSTLSRVGVFWDATLQTLREIEAVTQALGMTVLGADVQKRDTSTPARLCSRRVRRWVMAAAPHVRRLQQSGDVATAHRLPPTLHNRHAVEAGGLMSSEV